MLNLFIYLIIVLFIAFVADRILRRQLRIKKVDGEIIYKHINKFHKWGEILIVIITLLILFLVAFVMDNVNLEPHYFLVGLILLQIFRSIMEWKYIKESKQYILSIFSVIMFMVMYLGVEVIL